MNVEYYIQRPQPTVVVQLSEADETEILALLASPNLTNSRNSSGHWTFEAATGPDHQADDGDWVALFSYFVGSADDIRTATTVQRVVSADISFGVA